MTKAKTTTAKAKSGVAALAAAQCAAAAQDDDGVLLASAWLDDDEPDNAAADGYSVVAALANSSLAQALRGGLRARLAAGRALALVVVVPDPSWISPVDDAVRRVAPTASVVARDGSLRSQHKPSVGGLRRHGPGGPVAGQPRGQRGAGSQGRGGAQGPRRALRAAGRRAGGGRRPARGGRRTARRRPAGRNPPGPVGRDRRGEGEPSPRRSPGPAQARRGRDAWSGPGRRTCGSPAGSCASGEGSGVLAAGGDALSRAAQGGRRGNPAAPFVLPGAAASRPEIGTRRRASRLTIRAGIPYRAQAAPGLQPSRKAPCDKDLTRSQGAVCCFHRMSAIDTPRGP